MNMNYDEIKYLHIGNEIFEYNGMLKTYHKEFKFKLDEFDVIYISKDKITNDLSRFMVLKTGGYIILEECEKAEEFLSCCRQYYDFVEKKNNLYYIQKIGYKKSC